MNKRQLEIGNFYHIYNRGVEKRPVFMDDEDRMVFMHHICSLNSVQVQHNLSRDRSCFDAQSENLVNVHGFCLMNNHYHLLLEEIVEGGISKFMQKIGTGYTMYFNKKYNRSGVLFQGKYKSKHIHTDSHFNYILNYIHLNPYDQGRTLIMENLLKYKWSSLPIYLGVREAKFQEHVVTEYFLDYFGGNDGYRRSLQESSLYQSDNLINNGSILIDALD